MKINVTISKAYLYHTQRVKTLEKFAAIKNLNLHISS